MTKEELLHGIYEIGEWIYGVSDVADEDIETEENAHILYFYKILNELEQKLRKN